MKDVLLAVASGLWGNPEKGVVYRASFHMFCLNGTLLALAFSFTAAEHFIIQEKITKFSSST